MRRLSDAEALTEIERLVEVYRVYRSTIHSPEHLSYLVLKRYAEDLRGRQPAAIAEALTEIERALDQMHATKNGLGFEAGSMRHVAEQVVGRWPTIKQALILFGIDVARFSIDSEGWLDMKTAPRTATEIVLRVPKDGHPGFYRVVAHWADGGGDEQPRFRGWFRDTGYGFAEISADPTGWKPL